VEAAALNGPPEWLERIVLRAIPPAAREAVAGDLWETYQNPGQYAAEALHTVPFVIASQIRRTLNLPALTLQGTLIFICLGGPATLILLPALMLGGAYQATARPCPRRAFREAILLSSGAMVLLFLIMSVRFPFVARSGVDHFTWLSLFLLGLLLSPFLCLLRAGLIMQGDRCIPLAASDLAKEELACGYRGFLHSVLCRNLLEAVALAFTAVGGFFFAWNTLLVGLFALAAFYLLVEAAPGSFPATSDFVSLRQHYQQELARQQQLRRFLRWLWFTPVLVALHARLAENDLAVRQPVTAMLDCVAAAVLCFLVTSLNREHGGRVQEQIGLLDRMRERMPPEANR
jgi:hypothetical protein